MIVRKILLRKINEAWERAQSWYQSEVVQRRLQRICVFGPGSFLLVLGMTTMVAPQYFPMVLALFFIFCGLLFMYAAYRLLRIIQRAQMLVRELQGRIVIHGVAVQEPEWGDIDSFESKKIILH